MDHLLILILLFLSATTQITSKTCDITTYGAKGDGKTDNTKAIQSAITDCLAGGSLVIPPGTFLSYPISVSGGQKFIFTIEKGATLLAGDNANWPVSGSDYKDFLTFSKCDGCTLTGSGLIDGGGTPWYILFDEGKLKYRRPTLVVIEDSSQFTFTNLYILNAPAFNVALKNVQGAEIGHLNITDEWYDGGTKEPHNTDGIDPGSNSQNIHIYNCYIYNGDDSVAVKPGTVAGGCTGNIVVENCVFLRGHGASIGSVPNGCVEKVTFRNITMSGMENGCRVKTYATGTGYVRDITWDGITIENTDVCIGIDTNYSFDNDEDMQENVGGKSGDNIEVSGITFSNIVGKTCSTPAKFVCQSSSPCTGIKLSNVDVSAGAKDPKMTCTNAHGTATNVKPASCLAT